MIPVVVGESKSAPCQSFGERSHNGTTFGDVTQRQQLPRREAAVDDRGEKQTQQARERAIAKNWYKVGDSRKELKRRSADMRREIARYSRRFRLSILEAGVLGADVPVRGSEGREIATGRVEKGRLAITVQFRCIWSDCTSGQEQFRGARVEVGDQEEARVWVHLVDRFPSRSRSPPRLVRRRTHANDDFACLAID